MTLTREDYDADGECVRRIAEQFVADHPEREVRDTVGRDATTDSQFEQWRWGVLAPYARLVVDRCEGDVSRVYVAIYTVMIEQMRLHDARLPPEPSPEVSVWSAAAAIVKAALYMAHGRDSMQAFMSGNVVIDSMHPRKEHRHR